MSGPPFNPGAILNRPIVGALAADVGKVLAVDAGLKLTASAVSGGMSIGGAVTSGTAGSVLFVGAGSVLAQDNANFFWDATNFRLGIGTNAPSTPLHLLGEFWCQGNMRRNDGGDLNITASGGGFLFLNGDDDVAITVGGTTRFEASAAGLAFYGGTPVPQSTGYTSLATVAGSKTLPKETSVLGTLVDIINANNAVIAYLRQKGYDEGSTTGIGLVGDDGTF